MWEIEIFRLTEQIWAHCEIRIDRKNGTIKNEHILDMEILKKYISNLGKQINKQTEFLSSEKKLREKKREKWHTQRHKVVVGFFRYA